MHVFYVFMLIFMIGLAVTTTFIGNLTHLLSKTISGTIWGTLDMILMGLSIYIVVATPFVMDVYHAHRAEILTEFGFIGRYADLTFPKILLFLLIFSIIGAFSSCIMLLLY